MRGVRVGLALAAACAAGSVAAAPPNVLVLFVDDLGYGDLGCMGNASISSPNLDALAAEGVLFTQWLSAASICTPSRGSLLTGRLPARIGLASSSPNTRVLHPTSPTGLPLSELTLAEALQARGYTTHMTGKWHLGIGKDGAFLPTNQGFENFYGMPITNVQTCQPGKKVYSQDTIAEFVLFKSWHVWAGLLAGALGARATGMVRGRGLAVLLCLVGAAFAAGVYIAATFTLLNRRNCLLYRDTEVVQQPVKLFNLTQRLTADAEAFIDRASAGNAPWFLYMSYVKVHAALFNNDEFGPVNYINNVAELDWSVGRLLAAIDRVGATDNTIIWFTSDNGPFKERFEEGGSSGPLRGAKGQIFEGGIRVPGIARFPARFPAGVVTNEPVSTMDIFPTTLDLVDAAAANGAAAAKELAKPFGVLDGKSLRPFLEQLRDEGAARSPHREMFHYCGEDLAAVRLDGRFKVTYATAIWEDGLDSCPKSAICGCTGSFVKRHDPPLVFDLDVDLSEKVPLAPGDAKTQALVRRAAEARAQHEQSFREWPSQENQLHLMQDLFNLPCCDPPRCACDKDQ